MPTIVVATDAPWLHDEIRSSLVGPGYELVEVTEGQYVAATVAATEPDLAIVDLQIGNMGGFAVAKDLQLEAMAGRTPEVPVLLLLDRAADVFLAKRASVAGYLVKPLDPGTLRKTVRQLLATANAATASTAIATTAAATGSATASATEVTR